MTFEYPEELYYRESHEWIDPDSGRVGISDFAQDELGDVVFVELPSVGATVEAGDQFGSVESIKAVSDLYAPVGGEIVAVNDALETTPELVNGDPFGEGWMLEVDLAGEVDFDDLFDAAAYREAVE